MVKQVYLSVRSGAWFVQRVGKNGLPVHCMIDTRPTSFFGRSLPDSVVCNQLKEMANASFDHALYGLEPNYGPTANWPTFNDDLPSRILSGRVQVRGEIARLTSSGVQFTDGTHVDDIDSVLCASGTSQSIQTHLYHSN